MSRPLDFIVYGVPRSGTKGLVRGLNLHPHVYCAMERFYFRDDHGSLTFPESFLDPSTIHDPSDLVKIEHFRKELIKKEDIRHAGNKLPRYYFALARINHELPTLKNIWIYRSPYGFMPSWTRRELESHRGQWPAGQVGLFGLLELLVCIENSLALPKDVFIFPYKQGLSASPQVLLEALDFLGADPNANARPAFEKKQRLRTKKQKRHKHEIAQRPVLEPYEEELLDALRIKELDALLEQDRGIMLSEIAGPLNSYLDDISDVLPVAIDRAFGACQNAAVPAFGRDHFKRHRPEFSGLLERTKGSEVLARFQRYGFSDHLKSVYVQRSAIKRRLGTMRSGTASS